MEDRLKTIIVEDQFLTVDFLRGCLDDRFNLLDTANTIERGWKAFQKHDPDAVLLDIELPDGSGIDLANRMLKNKKGLRILGISAKTDEYTLYQVFMTGFFGFVDKTSESVEDLHNAIDGLITGNCHYAAVVQQNMLLQRSNPNAFSKVLSAREQEMICHFGVGESNEVIAEKLELRPVSVQNHRQRIMRKLGLHTTVDLIRYSLKTGFVNPAAFLDS